MHAGRLRHVVNGHACWCHAVIGRIWFDSCCCVLYVVCRQPADVSTSLALCCRSCSPALAMCNRCCRAYASEHLIRQLHFALALWPYPPFCSCVGSCVCTWYYFVFGSELLCTKGARSFWCCLYCFLAAADDSLCALLLVLLPGRSCLVMTAHPATHACWS
jgi:hypothetical protein